jgi:hypothetical protein
MESIDGYCRCGCGTRTTRARVDKPELGLKKGDHFHYTAGHRKRIAASAIQRFDVDSETGCHVWALSRNAKGYPTLGGAWWRKSGGRSILAHRIAWEDANGTAVPEGWTVDHLCRNRACVNPEHLEAVPHWKNVRRGSRTKYSDAVIADVIRMRSEGATWREITERHGISRAQGIVVYKLNHASIGQVARPSRRSA